MSVTIKNLNKTFMTARGTVKAVREVNLAIEGGEFFSLLGPSRCGNTMTRGDPAGRQGGIFPGPESDGSGSPAQDRDGVSVLYDLAPYERV